MAAAAALRRDPAPAAGFLDGRTAWVTGGATGIGRATALALARAGARVAIGSLPASSPLGASAYTTLPTDSEMVQALAEIEGCGATGFQQALDLRSDASVDRFHDAAVAALGPVDILVNAAGVCAQESMLEAKDETWTTVIDINLTGAYRAIKRCLPGMIARGWGRIVSIGSTAAEVGFARHNAYCAAKHGLLGLSRCVALEGAAHGVTSNVINPGSVGTGLMRLGSAIRVAQGGQGADIEENMRLVAAANPQKRLIEADEIAALAVFLCREEARGLTAEAITVAGGAVW